MGQPQDAVECHKLALMLKPNLVEAHINLGWALLALGRTTDAQPVFERALALRPDSLEAHRGLVRTLLAGRHRDDAVEAAMAALTIRETPETKALFVEALLRA
jgi:tetratricopeptide (TPR) repeat protein